MNERQVSRTRERLVHHLKPGLYIVAVSGGVDSMVLLHMLQQFPHLRLVVAHYDHGMRKESQHDRKFVQTYAKSHNLTFVYEAGNLGLQANEGAAREARYNFLRQVSKNHNADAIITAHHQDDLLETAIINMIRGTGWRGLSSLQSHPTLLRPLLDTPKAELLHYANRHHLTWREDPTNANQEILRNFVRHKILTKFSTGQRTELVKIIVRQGVLRKAITTQLTTLLAVGSQLSTLPRYLLAMTPSPLAYELLQHYLQSNTGHTVERVVADQALLFVKTARPGKKFELNKQWQLISRKSEVIVERRQAMVS